ncbi:MAG: type II toxin-antitoxin system RelE/ParE family toxin [Thermodesulfobacteriota bacterium]|nr:type II toxin-antitoxin system RelE/ParE family toxin [Thermodesulfobacteriota bacterium]
MARTIKWTESATSDLEEVAEFIARDSRFYASVVVREARKAARSLGVSAERGRIVPERNSSDIRELFLWSYRLIYKVTFHHVYILAFIHGARDLESLWKRRGIEAIT